MEKLEKSSRKEREIDIDRSHELWDWSNKLKVSAERLKSAVLTVGRSVSAVRSFLKK